MENNLKGYTAKEARERTLAIKYGLFVWTLIYSKIDQAIEKGEFACDINVVDIVNCNPHNTNPSREDLVKEFIEKVDENLKSAGYRTTILTDQGKAVEKVYLIGW